MDFWLNDERIFALGATVIRGYHVFLALPMAIVSRAFYGLNQTPSGLNNFGNYKGLNLRSRVLF